MAVRISKLVLQQAEKGFVSIAQHIDGFSQSVQRKMSDYKGFIVNDQIEAQFFSMYLFQFSTCFEQPRAHHQENQLYQYNLWYIYVNLEIGE